MGEYDSARKGFWHEPSGTPTSTAKALEAWTREAHGLLTEVAGTYHRTVTDADLATWLQERTSIHTTRAHEKWMGQVLTPLIAMNDRLGEPPLVSLVITERHRRVGDWYVEAMVDRAGAPRLPESALEREKHAAFTRLECYRWAGSAPADGGVPAPVGQRRVASTGTSSTRRRSGPVTSNRAPAKPGRVAKTDVPVKVCPTCFMALPATGVCDTCD